MLKYTDYIVQAQEPIHPSKPILTHRNFPDDLYRCLEDIRIEAEKRFKIELDKYTTCRDFYYAEETRLRKAFESDVLLDTGLQDHPHAHELFMFAWDRAHVSGLNEVHSLLSELRFLGENQGKQKTEIVCVPG